MRSRLILILAALLLAFCASPSWAQGSSPEAVAQKFTKAYFMLDGSMAEFLSQEALTNENDVNMVELYLRLRQDEANARGLKLSYLRMQPILIKTTVTETGEETAVVEVRTTALRSINPLYRAVGYLFCLIQEHQFETTLNLVKEEGSWKIGPGALGSAI